jgi:hypothetical protein
MRPHKIPLALATIIAVLAEGAVLDSASAQGRRWGSTHYGVDLNRAPNPGVRVQPLQRPPVATSRPLRGGAPSVPKSVQ